MPSPSINGDMIFAMKNFIQSIVDMRSTTEVRQASDELCGAMEKWVRAVSPPGCGNHIPEEISIMVDDLKQIDLTKDVS